MWTIWERWLIIYPASKDRVPRAIFVQVAWGIWPWFSFGLCVASFSGLDVFFFSSFSFSSWSHPILHPDIYCCTPICSFPFLVSVSLHGPAWVVPDVSCLKNVLLFFTFTSSLFVVSWIPSTMRRILHEKYEMYFLHLRVRLHEKGKFGFFKVREDLQHVLCSTWRDQCDSGSASAGLAECVL